MALDAKQEWIKLRRRINLAYYIGLPAVMAIEEKVTGGTPVSAPTPDTLGVDVDGDGEVDAKYVKTEG